MARLRKHLQLALPAADKNEQLRGRRADAKRERSVGELFWGLVFRKVVDRFNR